MQNDKSDCVGVFSYKYDYTVTLHWGILAIEGKENQVRLQVTTKWWL